MTRTHGLLRSWIGPDGEEWLTIHPFWAALKEHHEALAGRRVKLEEFQRLAGEYGRGERSIPDGVQIRARELDAEQRAAGYDGDEA